MKNARGISFLIVAVTLAFGFSVFADQRATQDPAMTMRHVDQLIDVMEQTEAQAEKILLHHGAAHETFDQKEDAERFARQLAGKMGLNEISDADIPTPPGAVAYQFQGDEQRTNAALRVIATPNGDRWEAYVTAKLTADANERETLGKRLETVYRALEDENIAPQFYVCAQGFIDDKLTDRFQTNKLNEMLALLGAEVIEKAEDPTVKSLSAYTPDFPFYIRTNGEKMNTQAAAHVDHLHGQTRITVGTPIITIEY